VDWVPEKDAEPALLVRWLPPPRSDSCGAVAAALAVDGGALASWIIDFISSQCTATNSCFCTGPSSVPVVHVAASGARASVSSSRGAGSSVTSAAAVAWAAVVIALIEAEMKQGVLLRQLQP
jgi:hypothetical protein